MKKYIMVTYSINIDIIRIFGDGLELIKEYNHSREVLFIMFSKYIVTIGIVIKMHNKDLKGY